MEQPGLRHRDKDSEISKKHGNTLVGTLRRMYGPKFAGDAPPHMKLSELLSETGTHTLSELHRQQLRRDQVSGELETKIERNGVTH